VFEHRRSGAAHDFVQAQVQAAQSFHRGLPGGELPPVIGPSSGVMPQLPIAALCRDAVHPTVPGTRQPVPGLRPGGRRSHLGYRQPVGVRSDAKRRPPPNAVRNSCSDTFERGVMDLHDLRQLANHPPRRPRKRIQLPPAGTLLPQAGGTLSGVSKRRDRVVAHLRQKMAPYLPTWATVPLSSSQARRLSAASRRRTASCRSCPFDAEGDRDQIMSQHNANVACVHMPRTPQWPAGRSPPRLRCSKRWASPPLCGENPF